MSTKDGDQSVVVIGADADAVIADAVAEVDGGGIAVADANEQVGVAEAAEVAAEVVVEEAAAEDAGPVEVVQGPEVAVEVVEHVGETSADDATKAQADEELEQIVRVIPNLKPTNPPRAILTGLTFSEESGRSKLELRTGTISKVAGLSFDLDGAAYMWVEVVSKACGSKVIKFVASQADLKAILDFQNNFRPIEMKIGWLKGIIVWYDAEADSVSIHLDKQTRSWTMIERREQRELRERQNGNGNNRQSRSGGKNHGQKRQ